jgi:hypothetical protein
MSGLGGMPCQSWKVLSASEWRETFHLKYRSLKQIDPLRRATKTLTYFPYVFRITRTELRLSTWRLVSVRAENWPLPTIRLEGCAKGEHVVH